MEIVDHLIPDEWENKELRRITSTTEVEVTKDIIARDNRYKSFGNSFTNITFLGFFEFKDFELKEELEFINCKFKKRVRLIDFRHDSQFSGIIRFENCVFEYGITIEGVQDRSSFGDIEFDNCTFEKLVAFKNISGNLLKLWRSTFRSSLSFNRLHSVKQLNLWNNTIEVLELRNFCECDVLFEGENIIKHFFKLQNGEKSLFDFKNVLFSEVVGITLGPTMKECTIVLSDCEFKKDVTIFLQRNEITSEENNNSFRISNNRFERGLLIQGANNDQNELSFIHRISLGFSNKAIGEIAIRNLKVGFLEFHGYNSYCNITVKDILVHILMIADFTSISGFRLINIHALKERETTSPIVIIRHSQLGNALLSNINFQEFEDISLDNIVLSAINTSMINWFLPEHLNAERLKQLEDKESSQEEFSKYYQSQQEIYRQLKVAAQKEGNIPQSLEFQRNEMRFYKKRFRNHKLINAAEYFILWSNQSNSFGQNWIKAASLLLFFSFIAYIPVGFLVSDKLNYDQWLSSWNDVKLNIQVVFSDNIRYWFVILNPTHRVSDIGDHILKVSGWLYFWDMFSRVIVSYFIFQTVSAFRKFNK